MSAASAAIAQLAGSASLPAAAGGTGDPGRMATGEVVLFIAVALITVACGLGVLTAKRAVSAAVNMIGIMISLAVLYIANSAPFLGITQIVVYTGAVMTLVLFVVMLVGVGGEEPMGGTTSRIQRPIIALLGLGLAGLLAAIVWRTAWPQAQGLAGGDAATPDRLAEVLFGTHVVTMELTALLLVVAAVGALTLTHRQRIRAKRSQGQIAEDKMRDYAATGAHPGQKPMPGVYASTNTAAAPALDAQGQVVEESIPRVLRARGQGLELSEASPEMGAAQRSGEIIAREDGAVGLSGMASMPGARAPRVAQPTAKDRPQDGAAQKNEEEGQ
ncbi:NADH-quinone oxidoreductase subunit J [Actinomyces slackii]|uniref:NADH-quinone oxidoreductase subunit J n=1 Tax=Actinomyces slackii TaxID=52774 RepID=A0A3S4WIS9_9ACTO|nr:NADH-quinone oxidoreductase subunit J [Actinomyces slackii]